MKTLLIFRFFRYIWFIGREHLFHFYFERKNDFDIKKKKGLDIKIVQTRPANKRHT